MLAYATRSGVLGVDQALDLLERVARRTASNSLFITY